MAVHGVLYRPAELEGFVAEEDGEPSGLITYHVDGGACEIVTLDSLFERRGIGSALLDAVVALGHARVWLTTTNDNTAAIGFYERHGFRVVAVHEGAVDRARANLKPEIPLEGRDGVEIHDEVELELQPA